MINKIQKDSPYFEFANKLLVKRELHSCNASMKIESIDYLNELKDFLFPHFSNKFYYSQEDVVSKLQLLERNLISLLKLTTEITDDNLEKKANQFITRIPFVHDMLWEDAEAIYKGDPAAESVDEVILAYPGFMAILIYRLAHELYKIKIPIIPRILTEHAHQSTGIDIHPGAEIDSPFFIDHGTGIVIGETTKIGKNVKVYQGVTLGALSVDKSLANIKRHPTIEDDVIIYSQAVILGGETVIGKNSIIGGNAWITQSVPPNSVVYSKIEVKVRSNEDYFKTIEFII
ncbi:MAG TPA: serine O-acetyltransferase EpsC [Ignavibacteriaceae bacterium]|nr:serine O-acetyltransferase EpsC [Ignavibacteriaceae bacterium]